MKLERSKVDFPLWRKKVDKSLFEHKGTTIPMWACEMWSIGTYFSKISSIKHESSKVDITFEGKKYSGHVTALTKGRKSPAYRLWFTENLAHELKKTFVMSHMRSLESSLRTDSGSAIETEIPFWEFLDIECDIQNKMFKFVAYYKQTPSFPSLFERLIGSPAIQKLEAEITKKDKPRIFYNDWKGREELEYEIGAQNVIYTLADTKHKLIYVGEATDLIKRLSQEYTLIKQWNYYRYDVLPSELNEYRVTIERMLIRSYAAMLASTKEVPSLGVAGYRLVNLKIDR